jgi:hypothetical protein
MRFPFRSDQARPLKDLNNDRSGMVLIYVTVMLPVIIGFALLAIDVGRLSTLHSSLQNGADAIALAAAGELDLKPDSDSPGADTDPDDDGAGDTDSISRAERAINTLVDNPTTFATSVAEINGSNVTRFYLKAIPANDAVEIDSEWIEENNTINPMEARFVVVRVTPVQFDTVFPASFLGAASNSASVSAESVAGMDQAVCNFTPLFMCNPFEPSGNTDIARSTELYAHLATRANRKRQIELLRSSQAAEGQVCGPGNFGVLQTDYMDTMPLIREALAADKPQACFIQNSIQTKTGNPAQSEPISGALNTRFDIYPNGGSFPQKSNPKYRPAMNVRKGYLIPPPNGNQTPNECNAVRSTDPALAMGLPRDSSFTNRLGNGDWGGTDSSPDFEQYWSLNFGSLSRPVAPDDGEPGAGTVYSNENLPTRYDIYRYEIDPNGDGNYSDTLVNTVGNAGAGEDGVQGCYTGGDETVTDEVDRRIIYGAIVNCRAYAALEINACNGHSDLQSIAFGKFFITEPVAPDNTSPPVEHLFTELIGLVESGQADSIARDMVQLYR